MSSEARSFVLESIRRGIRAGNNSAQVSGDAEMGAATDAAAEWAAIPRDYRCSSNKSGVELQHLVAERLRDYDAHVVESSEEELSGAIATLLSNRGVTRILVPRGLDAELLPKGFDFVPESELGYNEMNQCEGVLTESTLAIAETGTIVLQNVPGQGKRAVSLIPDYHLCLVDVRKIVATVPEAISCLQATASLPTTFISGPSATADIEMTRIKGVHGPRFLDVILIMK